MTTPVLVSVSVVVNAPVSERLPEDAVLDDRLEAFTDSLAERLQAAIRGMKSEPWFEEYHGPAFIYVEEEENAGRCARCGQWTSDHREPGFLYTLACGETVDGKLVCLQCLDEAETADLYAMQPGEEESGLALSPDDDPRGGYSHA